MDSNQSNWVEHQFHLDTSCLAAIVSNSLFNQANVQSKIPLLCLHGWLDNAASFLPMMPILSQHYDVIAIDLPGHGKSSHRSADAYYHFVDYVDDIYQLIVQEAYAKVHLIGHSMGGMIASAFSAAFPDKVASLTLIDSFGFISAPAEQAAEILRQGVMSRHLVKTKSKRDFKQLDTAIKARMQAGDVSYDAAKLLVERSVEKTANGFRWRSDQRLTTQSVYRLTPEQAKALVLAIESPFQVIYGSAGLAFVQEAIKKFTAHIPANALHCITGGHHVHMEKPEQTAKKIGLFIEQF
jgi:pimeloyl-ACP methyl ester carboxylesterase